MDTTRINAPKRFLSIRELGSAITLSACWQINFIIIIILTVIYQGQIAHILSLCRIMLCVSVWGSASSCNVLS